MRAPDLETNPTVELRRVGRWEMARCSCGWSAVSTGPQAEKRVRKRSQEHDCYPPWLSRRLGAPGVHPGGTVTLRRVESR